jgi:hypothetical protein
MERAARALQENLQTDVYRPLSVVMTEMAVMPMVPMMVMMRVVPPVWCVIVIGSTTNAMPMMMGYDYAARQTGSDCGQR